MKTNPNKLWIDDERIPPDNTYAVAKTYDAAIWFLTTHEFDEIYLDHDLGDFSGPEGRERTGYDVIMFLVERKLNGGYVPKKFHILTANPVGRMKFIGIIERYFSE